MHEVLGLGVLVAAWAGCYLIRPSGSQPFSHFAFAYTKHEIPLSKLHDTRDSPCEITRHMRFPLAKITRNMRFPLRNYKKHDILREITQNMRFPVRNYTKHEIPRAKLHETRDSPREITRNTRFPVRNYTKTRLPAK